MDRFAPQETPVASDSAIVEHYPLPLALVWERALIASPRAAFHHRQLLVAAEWLAYYLGAIGLSAYEQAQAEGGTPDPTLNRSIRNLRRPTFGQWLGWIREALAALPPDTAVLPGLGSTWETADTSMLFMAYEGLRSLMVVQLGYTGEYGAREAASPRLLLELINQYEIRRANHPMPADSGFDEIAVVSVLAPGLRAAFSHVALLTQLPLLGLVRTSGGGVEVLRLMGTQAAPSTVELEEGAEAPGTLLLADGQEQPMLVLDPWLVYAECPECGQLQVAAFQGQADAQRRYLGVDCEHTWSTGMESVLAEVEVGTVAAGEGGAWTPEAAGFPADVPTDAQERLYAQLEAESDALERERRARIAAPPAEVPQGEAAQTTPEAVYLDLLEQRAARGLTVDQLQGLDETRAAERHRGHNSAGEAR